MLDDHFNVAEQNHNSRELVVPRDQDPPNPGNGVSQASDSSPDLLCTSIPGEFLETKNYESPASWRHAIGQLQGKYSLLDLAMSALSMVRLGRVLGNERMYSEGVAKYGRVLKDLQNILASDSLALEEQNLASCMTLTILEVCNPGIACLRRG